MMSLKAFAPVLASTLGTTPAAIYERQRALVREGLLPAPIGRGRGNGVPATAENVAMILIALMVTDNLSDTDNRVQRVAEAKIYGKRLPRHLRHHKIRCRLTGKRDFKSALISVLRMTEFPTGLSLSVSRNYFCSKIFYLRDGVYHLSEFGDWSGTASNLVVEASLRDGVLEALSRALRSENKEGLPSR
jgi:hypothetical protein